MGKKNSDGGESRALVPITETFHALSVRPDQLKEVILANFETRGPSIFDLERIRVGSAGSSQFRIRHEDGDEEETGEFKGVICFFKDTRTWWRESYDESGGGSPPDCCSDDMYHGIGDNSKEGDSPGTHECQTCPHFQWKSDRNPKSSGKDCKESRLLFVLREGRDDNIFPSVLVVPAGSLKSMRAYLTSLTSQMIAFYHAMHVFSLEKAKSSSGITYSQLRIKLHRRLEEEEKDRLLQYATDLKTAFMGLRPDQQAVGS